MEPGAVSFVIPTTARNGKVGALLRELAASPAPRLEVIVVFNGAPAETAAGLRAQFADEPRIVFTESPTLGLTPGRLQGARVSRREFVWYLDDDVRLPPGFFAAWAGVELAPDCAFGGGPLVLPPWVGLPDWAQDPLRLHDLSITVDAAEHRKHPIGANCFCRREALLTVAPVMEQAPYVLDRQGSNLLSCGEMFIWALLERAGWKGQWETSLAVYHDIALDRIDQAWFVRRAVWQGISTLCLARNLGLAAYLRLAAIWLAKASILAVGSFGRRLGGRVVAWRQARLQLITSQVFAGFWPILLGRMPRIRD